MRRAGVPAYTEPSAGKTCGHMRVQLLPKPTTTRVPTFLAHRERKNKKARMIYFLPPSIRWRKRKHCASSGQMHAMAPATALCFPTGAFKYLCASEINIKHADAQHLMTRVRHRDHARGRLCPPLLDTCVFRRPKHMFHPFPPHTAEAVLHKKWFAYFLPQ